jgi:ankyrin repeat protein
MAQTESQKLDQRLRGLLSYTPVNLVKLAEVLRLGADVNSTSSSKNTALHTAAAMGDLPAVEMLLAHGADVDALDVNACSPFLRAAAGRHLEVMEVLVKAGASLRRGDDKGCNALGHFVGLALSMRRPLQPGLSQLLDWGVDPNPRGVLGRPPLVTLAQMGDIDAVLTMLDAGADGEVEDKYGHTALMAAISARHFHLAHLLIARKVGMKAGQQMKRTATALDIALLTRGGACLLRPLLRADVWPDDVIEKALDTAVRKGRVKEVAELWRLAPQHKPKSLVEHRYLLEQALYSTAAMLDFVCRRGSMVALESLPFAAIQMVLREAAPAQKSSLVEVFLRHAPWEALCASPDPKRQRGRMQETLPYLRPSSLGLGPFHRTWMMGQDAHGVTALMEAAHKGSPELILALLAEGVPVEGTVRRIKGFEVWHKDMLNGDTLLHVMARRPGLPMDVWEAVLQRTGNEAITVQDSRGRTPLDLLAANAVHPKARMRRAMLEQRLLQDQLAGNRVPKTLRSRL